MMATGKLRELERKLFRFEWIIEDFFSLDGESYTSPLFSYAGESWYMVIYPNGDPTNEEYPDEFIDIHFHREISGPPIKLSWELGLETEDMELEEEFTHIFEGEEQFRICSNFLKRSLLLEKESELMPSGVLALFCNMNYYSKPLNDSGNTVTSKCSYCEEVFGAECVSSHEKKCLVRPIKCPACNDVIELRKWLNHECSISQVTVNEKVIDDLTEIFNSEKYSDVTVTVKDKEFHLHRSILAGRNAYFRTMFDIEMKEKRTGTVSIEDCEPDIFHSFAYFVYTGKMPTLTCDNIGALYKVADKYQEDQLKTNCLCFMKNRVSVDSFCDFVTLALVHNEQELLQKATELFCKETKEIIQSVKWQKFMREYPTEANELYIKLLDYNAKELMKYRTHCE